MTNPKLKPADVSRLRTILILAKDKKDPKSKKTLKIGEKVLKGEKVNKIDFDYIKIVIDEQFLKEREQKQRERKKNHERRERKLARDKLNNRKFIIGGLVIPLMQDWIKTGDINSFDGFADELIKRAKESDKNKLIELFEIIKNNPQK